MAADPEKREEVIGELERVENVNEESKMSVLKALVHLA